jgi:hypothetical protein
MSPLSRAEEEAFAQLKSRLARLWTEVFPKDDEHYTSVVVPSVTLDPDQLVGRPELQFYEEVLMFLLIRLRNPKARVIYVTSQPLPQALIDYYLQFLAGIPASHAVRRLVLLSPHDASARPLSAKLLERPRLIERIRAAIPDRSRAYLTVLRSTELEVRLALRLDLPLNAPDPESERLLTKSGARRVLRDAGLEVPFGYEGLRDTADLLEALDGMRRQRPALRQALVKLETSFWSEGRALVDLPATGGRDALAAALDQLRASDSTASAYLSRFSRLGGVVEELVEGPLRDDASVQIRINPVGRVSLTSTHDELRGGSDDLNLVGCRFPADDAYRLALQEAGLRVGQLLAKRGLVTRLSIEFLVRRAESGWRLVAREINLGVGGSTHPLLAVRFLCGGQLDPVTGLFYSPHGRPKYYRCTDNLQAADYRQLVPEDLVELLTLERLNYSPHGEVGAVFYMLGGVATTGRLGIVAIGNSHQEADAVFARTVATLDAACGRAGATGGPGRIDAGF